MAGLSHQRALAQINALLDEALDPSASEAVKHHLAICPTCSAEVARWTRIRVVIKHAYAPAAVPPDLVSRVRTELHRVTTAQAVGRLP